MPKPYSLRLVIKTLESKGENPTLTVIVPIHGKEIRYGTFRSILRQSKLKEEDFQE